MENGTLKSGSQLKNGEYSIVRVLGQGGFGITYEGLQNNLKRRVAIKEFFMRDSCQRDADSPVVTVPTVNNRELVRKFKKKFIREAQMIASFDSEHIVRIHDVFEQNGTAYYVMEYLPGGSLSDAVKSRGALSESKALDYIRQIADALGYLHEQKTLHFDVKPSNVLLNHKGQIKLIDFGISKHYDEAGSQTSSTPVGLSKGFAPLEQYQQGGDVSRFTPATDIYALGATLYYLLTGTVPPDASDVNEEGLPAMPGVSRNLVRAIEKAMSPRKKDRPQSVEAFLDSFESRDSVKSDTEKTTTNIVESKPKTVQKRYGFYLCAFVILYLVSDYIIFSEHKSGGLDVDEVAFMTLPMAIGAWCLFVWMKGMSKGARNCFLILTVISVIFCYWSYLAYIIAFCMVIGSLMLLWNAHSKVCKVGVRLAFILSFLCLAGCFRAALYHFFG